MPSTSFYVSDHLTDCWANSMHSINILLIEKNKQNHLGNIKSIILSSLFACVIKILYIFII